MAEHFQELFNHSYMLIFRLCSGFSTGLRGTFCSVPSLFAQPREERAGAGLEAVVLEHVDERVDATVQEDRYDGEVVERTAEVCGVAKGEHEKVHL